MRLQQEGNTEFTWFCPFCGAHGYANASDIFARWISKKGVIKRIQFIKCMKCHRELTKAVPDCFKELGTELNKRESIEEPGLPFPED